MYVSVSFFLAFFSCSFYLFSYFCISLVMYAWFGVISLPLSLSLSLSLGLVLYVLWSPVS